MKRWIPVIIMSVLAVLSTICAIIAGIGVYLAVTGLDLLVMAKYELPRLTLILFIAAGVLWTADIICLFALKPYTKR